jgi:hypothetical protein
MEVGIFAIINQVLSWMTVRSKARGQLYALLGFVANWYLLYLGYELYKNGATTRGILILAGFIVLLYFSVLNLIYYFSDKTVSWDISPALEKILGSTEEESEKSQTTLSNGIYTNNVLPATLKFTTLQSQNFMQLLNQLQQAGINGKEIIPPFFTAKYTQTEMLVYAGINQLDAKPIATISKIGFGNPLEIIAKNRVSIANVIIKKESANANPSIDVYVAYSPR